MKFDKQEAEHELKMQNLTHKFALKMASLICFSVIATVTIAGLFFGIIAPIVITVLFITAIILGVIAFSVTRSACL